MNTIQNFVRILIPLICILPTFSYCKKDKLKDCDQHSLTTCSIDPAKINLRIKNISNYDFCNMVVNPSSGEAYYGIIKKGEMTCYRPFNKVYRYGYLQFYIGEEQFRYLPIDYVGEQPLKTGKFTYLVDIVDYQTGEISITVQED